MTEIFVSFQMLLQLILKYGLDIIEIVLLVMIYRLVKKKLG